MPWIRLGGCVTALAVAFGLAGCGGSQAFSDSTTCQQFTGASQSSQTAYAQLYIREYGLPGQAQSPSDVVAAIDNGCTEAFDTGSADTTVVEAVQSPNG